jgi:hypothetical protein
MITQRKGLNGSGISMDWERTRALSVRRKLVVGGESIGLAYWVPCPCRRLPAGMRADASMTMHVMVRP